MIHRQLSVTTLPWPTDWGELFGVTRPLILEIGFGNAAFLLHLAQTRPDHNVIGVEISNQSMVKAERKIAQARLNNACAVHGRGETALHHLFAPATLREIHINNPDPWFKKRHSGRRIMQRDTLDAIVSRLEPGGWFYLSTDVAAYATMSDDLLRQTPGLDNRLNAPWVDHLPGHLLTKYMARGRQQGRDSHYFAYVRNDQPAPAIPVQEELAMPHVIVHTPQKLDDILARVERTSQHVGDHSVVTLIHAYINHPRNVLLFEVHIEEPTIEQHTAFMLVPRETPDDYIVRLTSLGQPRPTLGVHRAAGFLGDWIAAQHPDAHVIDAKIRR